MHGPKIIASVIARPKVATFDSTTAIVAATIFVIEEHLLLQLAQPGASAVVQKSVPLHSCRVSSSTAV
jgi:hypothetical protein